MKVIAIAVLASCVGTLPDHSLHHVNRMLLGAAVLTTACDLGSTRRGAVEHWSGEHETNLVLGRDPSPGRVDAYAAVTIAGVVALGLVLPERLRFLFLAAVTAEEIYQIEWNFGIVDGICGLPGAPIRPPQ